MLTTVQTHDIMSELRVKHGQHKSKAEMQMIALHVPWQINSNATLKILWEISEWRQHLKNYNLENGWKTNGFQTMGNNFEEIISAESEAFCC